MTIRLVLAAGCLASAIVSGMSFGNAYAQSTNDISLNLRYNDPADPTEGGIWRLVAKTNSPYGIAGINAYLSNVDIGSIVYGDGVSVTAATIGAITNDGAPLVTAVPGGVNLQYAQDLANGPIVLNVGSGVASIGNDPLWNPVWHGASLIASGTFGASRPAFIMPGGASTDSNTLSSDSTMVPAPPALAANENLAVRGDSLATFGLNTPSDAGLIRGDVDRNGIVSTGDLNVIITNDGKSGPSIGWDQGDMNDDNKVEYNGAEKTVAHNWRAKSIPPGGAGALTVSPEPTSLVLVLLFVLFQIGLWARTRVSSRG